ncbi:MAG: prolyl oligopeptidase family serine peptidase [Caldimonas sp.]
MGTAFRRVLRIPALCAALASCVSLHAQSTPDPQLPTIKSFFRNADVSDVRLSPSGEWLALVVGGDATRKSLAVVDVDNRKPPVVIARFADADIRSFRWVGDDRLVFNVFDGLSGGGEQPFGPGLYAVHRDGNNLRQLIKPKREFFRDTSPIRRETLEWNHHLLGVPLGATHEVLIGENVYNRTGEPQGVNALSLDIDTGRVRSLAVGSPPYSREWLFDPQGQPRVIVAEHDGVAKTYWRAPGQDAWAVIDSSPALHRPFTPYFVDGSEHLFVRDGDTLRRFDFASGKVEKEPLIATPGFDLTGNAFLTADGKAVQGFQVITDAETTVWFDPKMRAIQKVVDSKLPGHTNRISTCVRCADQPIVLVHSWSDQDPGSFWLYRPATDAWHLIGQARSDIDPAKMATLDFYRIKARDGGDLPVWVTTPSKSAPGPSGQPRAAVVLVHGGPWLRGTYWQWNPDAQFLASRGYVVIEPEYRGGTGFGFDHFRAGWKQWEGPMQDDVADAVRWAAGKGLVDGKRVCIAGGSYGGYATLMGLVRYPDLYRCGVAWVAVTDPRILLEENVESDVSDEGRQFTYFTMIGDPVKDAEMLRKAAPVERAAEIRAPLLLAFGRDDHRVLLVHGNRMRDALHAVGQDPEFVVYDGEGHGWLKVEDRLDFWGRVERFLDKNLNGAPAPH